MKFMVLPCDGIGPEMVGAAVRVLENPATRTRDIGGTMGCKAFGQAVASAAETA